MKVAIVGTRNEKKISYEEFVGKLEAILKLYEIVNKRSFPDTSDKNRFWRSKRRGLVCTAVC